MDEHPLPTIDELFYTVAGGAKFSKIDLKQAYLQMEVHPDDREMLTLNTHRGLYKCTRLLYGIASAPAIWQREIENILKDIPGVAVFLDDIKISGPTNEIHLQRLRQVLNRLSEYNIQINMDKCEFFKEGIHYCGYYINKNGVHKEKAKIEAIENMRRPTNTTELRAFLGMINYYGRFIQNVSTILDPLYKLLEGKQGKKLQFNWNSTCETAFQEAKKAFMSEKILAHYNPVLPTIVACDASAYGVGAVLSQKQPDGSERVIQYASQSLTNTQRKYSQIDKEAYAIIFAIKKFYQYLFGNHFVLYTDHRPLTQIFAPGKGLPAHSALRMQHYAIFLQGFSYEVKYRNTKLHGNADGLSRLPITRKEDYEYDVVDNFEISIIESLPITRSELSAETEKDSEVKALLRALQSGNDVKPCERFNISMEEFSCQDGIILRDCRAIIPQKLRSRILQELHSEHAGIVKMKACARQYVWWPRIDHDLENLAKNCTNCNLIRNNPKETKTYEWERTNFPFQRVHIDYAGPFMGHYFFVLVDAFSKWPEVCITKDMKSNTTVQKCRKIFSTFGIPETIVSDNGRHFISNEFAYFLQCNGIDHKTTAPFHPATNGQAERFVQTLKMALKKKFQNNRVHITELQKAVQQILFHYRTTPHLAVGMSPAEKMFNRKLRTRLTLLVPNRSETNRNNNIEKLRNTREFQVGDRVECRNYYGSTKWMFGEIEKRIGFLHYMIRLDNGACWKRHIDQIQKVGDVLRARRNSEEMWDYNPPETEIPAEQTERKQINRPQDPGSGSEAKETKQTTPRKSLRNRVPPERYGKQVTH